MTHITDEIEKLRQSLLKMMFLTIKQLKKGEKAILDFDKDLAHEIMENETRVNAYELKIDEDCENILALYTPVANDLRFVLAAFKINTNLERMGDYAEGIARYILHFEDRLAPDILEKLRFQEMYNLILEMLNNVVDSFETEDTKKARKIFLQDKIVNEINIDAPTIIIPIMKEKPEQMKQLLYLLSIIKKLERVGDLAKNMAEDTIFYVEAKVLKHQNKTNKK